MQPMEEQGSLRQVASALTRGWLLQLSFVLLSSSFPLQAQEPAPSQDPKPSGERQQALLRMLRQDCGSCHGMRLTGGLGPALPTQAMRELPRSSIAAVIYHGRPGTPMPGWKTMLSADEAEWLADVLQGEAASAAQESKS